MSLRASAIVALLLSAHAFAGDAGQNPGPAATAQPQAAAPTVAPSSAPNNVQAALAPQPVSVPAGRDGIAADMESLGKLSRDAELAQKRVQVLQANVQAAELEQTLNPVKNGVADVPQLVSIDGAGDRLSAEFRIGTSFTRARAGAWITPEWQVLRVTAAGVELQNKDGRKYTALFGARPVIGASALPQQPAANYSGGANANQLYGPASTPVTFDPPSQPR